MPTLVLIKDLNRKYEKQTKIEKKDPKGLQQVANLTTIKCIDLFGQNVVRACPNSSVVNYQSYLW